jgi:acyl carrier protein
LHGRQKRGGSGARRGIEPQGSGERIFAPDALLGAIPELDSMAVVALITTLEERFGFTVDDDEIDGAVFVSLATLIDFVQGKLAA